MSRFSTLSFGRARRHTQASIHPQTFRADFPYSDLNRAKIELSGFVSGSPTLGKRLVGQSMWFPSVREPSWVSSCEGRCRALQWNGRMGADQESSETS